MGTGQDLEDPQTCIVVKAGVRKGAFSADFSQG
jgi:hypothetical protein